MLGSFSRFLSNVQPGDDNWQRDARQARSVIIALVEQCMHSGLEIEAGKAAMPMYKAVGKVVADLSILAGNASSSAYPFGSESFWIIMFMGVLDFLLPRLHLAPLIKLNVSQLQVSVHLRRWAWPGATPGDIAALPYGLSGLRMLLRNNPSEQETFVMWCADVEWAPPAGATHFLGWRPPPTDIRPAHEFAFYSEIECAHVHFVVVSNFVWMRLCEDGMGGEHIRLAMSRSSFMERWRWDAIVNSLVHAYLDVLCQRALKLTEHQEVSTKIEAGLRRILKKSA